MHENLEAAEVQSDSGTEIAVPDVVRNFPFFYRFTADKFSEFLAFFS